MKVKSKSIIALIAFIFSVSGFAESSINLDAEGKILSGYDVTEYHSSKQPVQGKDKYSWTYKGAKYLFKNKANLTKFKKKPEKFIPQNGGFCNYGVYLGKKFDVNPRVW